MITFLPAMAAVIHLLLISSLFCGVASIALLLSSLSHAITRDTNKQQLNLITVPTEYTTEDETQNELYGIEVQKALIFSSCAPLYKLNERIFELKTAGERHRMKANNIQVVNPSFFDSLPIPELPEAVSISLSSAPKEEKSSAMDCGL